MFEIDTGILLLKEKPLPSSYKELTREYLLNLFNYNEETGTLTRRCSKTKTKVGWVDGVPPNGGYLRLKLNGKCYYAQRIIWLIHTGNHVPDDMEVDHINRIRTDNRFCNFRLVTRNQNCWNYSRPITNKTGFKGVNFDKRIGKYRARIKVFSVRKHLGAFNNLEEAAEAYKQAAVEYFGEFKNDE